MTELLLILALLACPLGMGAMMWFMMRGNNQQPQQSQPQDSSPDDAEVARLRAELDQLWAEKHESERRKAPDQG